MRKGLLIFVVFALAASAVNAQHPEERCIFKEKDEICVGDVVYPLIKASFTEGG